MKKFNPDLFRAQFPAISGKNVYLDSAATALKPLAVIEATDRFYRQSGGTVHRSQFLAARTLTENYESARDKVTRLLNAPHSQSVVWTKGTTESLNIIAQCYARPRLRAGDEIIVSEAEHHANLVPWLMVAKETGARIVKLPVGEDLLPDLTLLPALISEKTCILALGQMSNVTGGCPDLASAVSLAHQVGAAIVVDGAQGIVHCPPDVQALDIDFYAFSAHKLYGPGGTGVLYAKPELLEAMSPWLGGGKMITEVSFSGFTLQPIPYRFEAGTPNVAGVMGFCAALNWLETIDQSQAESWSCGLADRAQAALAERPGFRHYRYPGSSLLAFNFDGVHHQDMATLLAESGVELRAGQHCAQPLLAALGVSGTLRASFAPYNNQADVDRLIQAVDLALTLLVD